MPDAPGQSAPAQPASSDQLFQLMIRAVRDYAIVLLDTHGNVLSWNAGAQRILGYEEREIVGQHFARFFTPEDLRARRPEHELREAARMGVAEDENWLVRKDGTTFYSSGVTTALRDDALRGYSKIFRDLTERKRLDEEARRRADTLTEVDRRKDEFLAMLSHELRNPLAPIMHALEVLRHDRADNRAFQQARDVVERQVRQLTHLIDDLLDVTRMSRDRMQISKAPVELGIVLARAVESITPSIEKRRHALSLALPDEPVWVEADPTRLEQVMVNLLNNAVKYTEPGGRVRLAATAVDDRVVIAVQDSGAGIAPELLPRIFDLFAQAEGTRHQSEGGLGIGLALVKRLVELHGGTVRAASRGRGHGSEFTVELPTIPTPVTRSVAPPPIAAAAPASLRILIVDDNMDTADSLDMLLKLQGYETRTANDGLTAAQAAAEFRPDVILLDLGLPGADGYQVARRVRDDPDLRHTVLVAMTGYGQDADRRRTREAGFEYHLVKPADPATLQDVLATLANRRRGG